MRVALFASLCMAAGCAMAQSQEAQPFPDLPPPAEALAALLADPDDVEAFTAAVARVLEDPAEAARLRAAGLRRAAEYSWDRTAADMLGIFREIVP